MDENDLVLEFSGWLLYKLKLSRRTFLGGNCPIQNCPSGNFSSKNRPVTIEVLKQLCKFSILRSRSRRSRSEVLLEKGVPKICSKFTGEHPCRSVILLKNYRSSTVSSGHLRVATSVHPKYAPVLSYVKVHIDQITNFFNSSQPGFDKFALVSFVEDCLWLADY